MPRLGVAPHPDVPLGDYRHYKGDRYVVVGGIFDAEGEGDDVKVRYISSEHGYEAYRSVPNFLATVTLPDGTSTPRFLFIPRRPE